MINNTVGFHFSVKYTLSILIIILSDYLLINFGENICMLQINICGSSYATSNDNSYATNIQPNDINFRNYAGIRWNILFTV